MIKNLFIASLTVLAGFAAQAQSYSLDKSASKLRWHGQKVTGKHTGFIQFESGKLQADNGVMKSGEFQVDMNSITNTDIQDEGYNAKLVGHLKSDDFFGVSTYPVASFKVENVAELKGKTETHLFTGKVTIKEKTKTISIPATVTMEGETMKAKGTLVLDRSDFDVRYGSASFFDGLGDKLIYDEFSLEFDLTFSKD